MNPKLLRVSVGLVVAFAGAALFSAVSQLPPDRTGAPFVLKRNGDRYTLSASHAPLSAIAAEIRRQAGIELTVDTRLRREVTLSLQNVTLEEMLSRLSVGQALTYEKQGEATKLIGATLASDEKMKGPAATPAAGSAAGEKPARETLGPGVLVNSDRPLSAFRARNAPAIMMANAVIDTEAARKTGRSIDVPAAYRAKADTTRYLVQFDHRVGDADRAALKAAGAEVFNYVPHDTLAVGLDPAKKAVLSALAGVTHVEPFHPYFKMGADIRNHINGVANKEEEELVARGAFTALAFPGADAKGDLEGLGLAVVTVRKIQGRQAVDFRADPARMPEVLARESIQWVETKADRKTANDLSGRRTRARAVRNLYPTLDGSGVIINVTDSGVDFLHAGFSVDPLQAINSNANTRIVAYAVRAALGAPSDGVIGDNNGHGTHVSGSVLGNGALSPSVAKAPGSGAAPYAAYQFQGMAPKAKLVFVEDFISFADEEQALFAYSHGARLSNNSWGNSQYQYGLLSYTFDGLVRDADSVAVGNQEMIYFFAAGNSGNGGDDGMGGTASTVGNPGNAKNVITVGSLELPRFASNLPPVSAEMTDSDDEVAGYSSRGPVNAQDWRMKPDVVAPGSYVLSTQSRDVDMDLYILPGELGWDIRDGNVDTGTNYAFMTGTSMATPITCGGAALVYQHYVQTLGYSPSPALMKALLVAGSRQLNTLLYRNYVYALNGFYWVGGDIARGWGMVDIQRAIEGPRVSPTDQMIVLDQNQTASLLTGGLYQRTVQVSDGGGGLKLVLAYTDKAALPGTGPALVNDLDITLLGPAGQLYYGNTFRDGIVSHDVRDEAGFGPYDGLNNVEVIYVPDAIPGTYTVRVSGWNVPDGPQDFALVIMKGVGNEDRMPGDNAAVTIGAGDLPVIAYAEEAAAYGQTMAQDNFRQIYVRQWRGAYADDSDYGSWKRLEDQWFGLRDSARYTGVSRSPGDSHDPSIAYANGRYHLAWVMSPTATNEADRIWYRQFDGGTWVEVGGSANGWGVSGEQPYDASRPVVKLWPAVNQPIIAWRQSTLTGSVVKVVYWNGSAWTGLAGSDTAGLPLPSLPGVVEDLDMIIDSAGQPVVAYVVQTATPPRIYVRRWNGSAWADLGTVGNAPYAQSPRLAAGPNGQIYITWVQYPSGSGNEFYLQVHAQRFAGGSWQSFGGSTTYPGISASTSTASRPYGPVIGVDMLNSNVTVCWQSGAINTNGGSTAGTNAIYMRRWNGQAWSTLAGATQYPGIAFTSGQSSRPDMALDGKGLPIIAFQNDGCADNQIPTLGGFDFPEEIFTYTFIGDRVPPVFAGLQNALGGTNNNVVLTWSPASDNISSTIVYRVYRGTATSPCGGAPACQENDVFANIVALVTNATTINIGGLANNQVYCFGVRAGDEAQLFESNLVMRSAGPVSGTGDLDGDCLPNSLEALVMTEACIKDTDSDGMWDGWEWTYSTNNPAHTLPIALSPIDNGTDNIRTPAVADGNYAINAPFEDPDGDGAANVEEFGWWLRFTYQVSGCETGGPGHRVGPDPSNPDTDGDGILDGWEIFNGLSPVNPADAAADPDGDGVSNLQEFLAGGDPHSTDSDSDGVPDGTELAAGTRLNDADSDHDGLDDGLEIQLGTGPTIADSNTNGVPDGDVYQLGFDNPAAAITNLYTLLFEDFETPSYLSWTSYANNAFVPFNLWHRSLAEPDADDSPGIRFLGERSPSNSIRCAYDPTATNVNATYNRGSVIGCSFQTPLIDASMVSNLFVSWNEFFQTEPNKDFVTVQARGGDSTNWFTVSTSLSGDSGGWTTRVADCSAFAGQSNIQIRFFFNAQNSINNEFAGWYVDDVRVYGGATIVGWVRDVNGRPVPGARVIAIGRGGFTNALDGHQFVLPGMIFGEAVATNDGSYKLKGLPLGKYYVKAFTATHRDEFWHGELVDGGPTNYAFGAGLNAGVYPFSRMTPQGYIDLTTPNSQTNCEFELETGADAGYLGVTFAGPAMQVLADGQVTRAWNGVATPAGAQLLSYASFPPSWLTDNSPDWDTNAVAPNLLAQLAPGRHRITLGSAFMGFPPPEFSLRGAEITRVLVRTNQAEGRIAVLTTDGKPYRVRLDGYDLTNTTPALLSVGAGAHQVTLVSPALSTNFPVRFAQVPIGGRARVIFTNQAAVGSVRIEAVDVNNNPLTNAEVYINGVLSVSSGAVGLATNRTPAVVSSLSPGSHIVTLRFAGYRLSEVQEVGIQPGVTNSLKFVLQDADDDHDWVGDQIEIAGYTNIFLFSRYDDPDADGLGNLNEYDIFRFNNVRLNVFNPDTDADLMPDGAEVGYDGYPGVYALSTLASNAIVDSPLVQGLFRGQYLAGIDNFGVDASAPAIDCDRFEALTIAHTNDVPPTKEYAQTLFENIPAGLPDRSVSLGHAKDSVILADGRPDRVDTDGDGMWDGFEYLYGLSTIAKLDVIGCGRLNEDPDYDGLSNYLEFLGPDGLANTNDWTDPTTSDTDDDGMPDGWEFFYGLNPNDPADAFADIDGDGLANLSEYLVGTNPRDPDTDGDALADGDEVLVYSTNPNDIDTDKDGLFDGREVYDKDMDGVADGGFFPMWQPGSDIDHDGYNDGPTDWDTDGDGMPDGFEVIDAFGRIRAIALNPFDPNDGDDDPDRDGLSNLQEYLVRDALYGNPPGVFDPNYAGIVWDYYTDPFNADSDGDGFPDGFEVIHGLHPMDPIPATPTVDVTRYYDLSPGGDLDGDGLFNWREYEIRFFLDPDAGSNDIYSVSTAIWRPDTDNDGLEDGEEDRTFRAHPIRQDTDGDRLIDGVNTNNSLSNTWAEIESPLRESEYLYVPGPITWTQALFAARIPHPRFPNVIGHLATFSDLMDFFDVIPNQIATQQNLLGVSDIAIGAYIERRKMTVPPFQLDESIWVSDELFLFDLYDFFGFIDTSLYESNRFDGHGYYMNIDTTFGFPIPLIGPKISTNTYNGYLIEWEDVPAVTNHYDRALNDMWALVWPPGSPWPFWLPLAMPPGATVPQGRWGAAASYVPEFATKNPKDNQTGTILMDNRSLTIIGGRDGVNRFKDVWQFQVRNFSWLRNEAPLYGPGGEALGRAEFASIPIFGYHNNRSNSPPNNLANPIFWRQCHCANVPYDCEGTAFGLPKNRPWTGSRTWGWNFVFGGWDEAHSYRIGDSFLKTEDDRRALTERKAPEVGVTEGLVKTPQGYELRALPLDNGTRILIGRGPAFRFGSGTNDVADPTGYSALNVGDFFLRDFCDDIQSAVLRLDVDEAPANPITVSARLEVTAAQRSSEADYNSDTDVLEPSRRFTHGRYWRSDEFVFDINPGVNQVTINITSQLLQLVEGTNIALTWLDATGALVAETNIWMSETAARLGLIFDASAAVGDRATIGRPGSYVQASYIPSYKGHGQWAGAGVRIQPIDAPPLYSRKSAGLVFDHERDRALLFGGIEGNSVLSDTWEAFFDWSGAFMPTRVTYTNILPVITPPARYGHSMAYDGKNNVVWMFGGFNQKHQPLNDLWIYANYQWVEVTTFIDGEQPRPRGGASMVYFGDYDFNRMGAYCLDNNPQKIVLFGGTDGETYFNDMWVFDDNAFRWVYVQPFGDASQAPTPRAFAAMAYAQNAFAEYPNSDGCASPAVLLFGGRAGGLPTGSDTDFDLVDDGVEHELGGTPGGRSPGVNKRYEKDDPTETLPFAFKYIGPLYPMGGRGPVADFEALSTNGPDFVYAFGNDLPERSFSITALLPQEIDLWYHRYGGEEPFDIRDVWELGFPVNSTVDTNYSPSYAHSGRWCYGTKLGGDYPNNALMELYSPVFELRLPPTPGTMTEETYLTSYYLMFYEWLNLSGSGDVVRVEVIRPETPADVMSRRSGLNKPTLKIVPDRNNAFNIANGRWRRVVAPLDIVANESNLFIRFSLQSDKAGTAAGWYIDDVAIVQGGEIDGTLTNLPNAEVVLYGINFNNHVLDRTYTDATGYFKFGLLPLGTYDFGAAGGTFGPVTLDPVNNRVNLGETAGQPVAFTATAGRPGRLMKWNTVPGLTYRIDWTSDPMSGVWTPLTYVQAYSTEELYIDYDTAPTRMWYRIVQVTTGP